MIDFLMKTELLKLGMKRLGIIALLLPVALSLSCSLLPPTRQAPSIPPTIERVPIQSPVESQSVILPDDDWILSAISPALIDRVESGTAREADRDLITALQTGTVYPISGLLLDTSPDAIPESASRKMSFVYILPQDPSGDGPIVAEYNPDTGELIETTTGYPIRVSDNPGVRIEDGPNGEQFYRYGYAWYPRWGRILPEPVIKLVEDFYSHGVAHVRDNLPEYRTVAAPGYSGGDLQRVQWDGMLITRMRHWGEDFPAQPFLYLPASGIDIQPNRFTRILEDGLAVVEDESIDQYLANANNRVPNSQIEPTRASVEAYLLNPLNNPSLFSEMERAIIVGALDDERGPLRIIIDFSMSGGYRVPDSGEKELFVAASEVDLMHEYSGIYLAKFSHEMAHLLEARDYPFIDERCWPEEQHMKEPLKYVLEFMWWVQQYPGDAPYWDWEPINSGLTLARLLTGYFPNSDC